VSKSKKTPPPAPPDNFETRYAKLLEDFHLFEDGRHEGRIAIKRWQRWDPYKAEVVGIIQEKPYTEGNVIIGSFIVEGVSRGIMKRFCERFEQVFRFRIRAELIPNNILAE